MNIRYLRDTHDAKAGDVRDVPDLQANVLIRLGIAEPDEPKHKPHRRKG